MTEAEFINRIQGELSVSGMLPTLLPESEIKRIIDDSALWFYENYEVGVQSQYYVVKKIDFNTEQFKKQRTLILPECVVSVTRVQEMSGMGRLGNIDRDFSENRLIASEIFLSSFHGEDLVMRTAQYQYYDLAKAFFLDQISYDFNRNTKQLIIKGRNPNYDVLIDTWIKIPIDKLYNDYYFRRYCTAQGKLSLARMLSMYPFPLPGGVEINVGDLRSEGESEIEKIITDIQDQNVPDWFIQFH